VGGSYDSIYFSPSIHLRNRRRQDTNSNFLNCCLLKPTGRNSEFGKSTSRWRICSLSPQGSAGRSEENDIESSKDAAIGHEQCFSSEGRQRGRRQLGIEGNESRCLRLSLYLKGWTQESIAETGRKVVELVSAGAQGEEIEKARHAARMVTSRLIEDRAQNGQMTEMCTILAKENPNEAIRAQQSIIRQYLGGHLLDPTELPPSRQVYDVRKFSRLNVNGPPRVQLNDIVVAAKNIRVVQILLVEDNPVDVQLLKERLNTVAIPTHLHAVRSVEVALGVLRYEGQAAQAPRALST
jgi:hypothetical protein